MTTLIIWMLGWLSWTLVWKQFKKYFQQKYLSDRYFDGKFKVRSACPSEGKEFHEFKLEQMTMDEY